MGESQTGSLIIKQGADTLKRNHLELGGKNPVIVFEDADLDRALDAAIFRAHRSSVAAAKKTTIVIQVQNATKSSNQSFDRAWQVNRAGADCLFHLLHIQNLQRAY